MPSDEGVRLDDSQSPSPRKQTGKQYQSEPASITSSASLAELALHEIDVVLRSDAMPHLCAKNHCSGAFVQLLCNQKCDGFSDRCRWPHPFFLIRCIPKCF